MKLLVVDKDKKGLTCSIIVGGVLGSRKGINVPGVNLNMPFISEQDKEDIISRIKGRIDYLKELRNDIIEKNKAIKEIKLEKKNIRIIIRDQKRLLRKDKATKFSLSRELITKKNTMTL